MSQERKSPTLLIADDDEDDRQWMREALAESRWTGDLRFVADGEELMDYLYHRGRYKLPAATPHPLLILLDLNMPKQDGREALREIKSQPLLLHIPVVILTTSHAQEDIHRCYGLGANSFIIKPTTYAGLVRAMHALNEYWFSIVELPAEASPGV
jgi:CheY-like chemotaxis protein